MKIGHVWKSPLLVLLGIFLTQQASYSQGAPSETKETTDSGPPEKEKGYLAEMMAYEMLAEAAGQIAKEIEKEIELTGIQPAENMQIVVTGEMELEGKRMLWELMRNRLRRFDKKLGALADRLKEFQAGLPSQAGGRMRSAPIILGTASQLQQILKALTDAAELFKSDVVLVNREVELEERVLVAELANELRKGGWNVVIQGLNSLPSSQLLELLDNLETRHLQVIENRQGVELEVTKQDDRKIKSEWKQINERINAVLHSYVEYRRTITEQKEGKASVVESVGLVETLDRVNAHRVHVQIASQGAEVHMKKGPWPPFGRTSYVGGVVCFYFWFDEQNHLKASGSIRLAEPISDQAAGNAWRRDQTESQKQTSP